MDEQAILSEFNTNAEYDAFVEKFKPKKTTDDCYTPAVYYDVVCDYVESRYGISRANFVRPFWPGADYTKAEYPSGCVVVDNPPFSILSKICKWYADRGIPFFLFCNALTAINAAYSARACVICTGATLTYENGAVVSTSFVTNMENGVALMSEPELTARLEDAAKEYRKDKKRHVPKYTYPINVCTAAMVQYYSAHGTPYELRYDDCERISALDAQRAKGKSVFGGGYLLSERSAAERAAAERAAAERAAAIVWELSDREKAVIAKLGERCAE